MQTTTGKAPGGEEVKHFNLDNLEGNKLDYNDNGIPI